MTDVAATLVVDTARISRVILKLARGHAAYELNEPQFDEPSSFACMPLAVLDQEARSRFETPPESSIWPEVGSRAMQRLSARMPAIPAWISVQNGRYRYLTSAGEAVMVRIVLSEYLSCEVVW